MADPVPTPAASPMQPTPAPAATSSAAADRGADEPDAQPARHGRIGRIRAAGLAGWASVRPRTRRGALLGLGAVVLGSAVLAVAFFVAAAMAWSPYVETAIHPDGNPRAWAALEPKFGGTGQCGECHETEAARAASAKHAGIGCESCHGPLLEHSRTSTATVASALVPVVPTDELCTKCHTVAVGRPVSLVQIALTDHYVPVCLQCHDPHTAISRRPPVVLHPLDNLPPCVTCHGPEAFKARSQRHPVVNGDEPCLACHAPGRGPAGD